MAAMAAVGAYLVNNFREMGAFDYKYQYLINHPGIDTTTDPGYQGARILGNFAYGATLASLGASYYITQGAGGMAQTAICLAGGSCGTGAPLGSIDLVLGSYPYGDQVEDAQDIQKGYNYGQVRRQGLCP